jgi:hypothetical protein
MNSQKDERISSKRQGQIGSAFFIPIPYIVAEDFSQKVNTTAKNNQSIPNCILLDLETLVYNFHEDGWYEHYFGIV